MESQPCDSTATMPFASHEGRNSPAQGARAQGKAADMPASCIKKIEFES